MQQVSDTAPTGAMLVDTPALPITQLLNINFQNRFKVLYDSKPRMLFAGTTAATALNSAITFPSKLHFNVKKKCNIIQKWNGPLLTDIQKNGIYVFFYTNAEQAGPVYPLDFVASSRISFTDA